MIAFTTIALAAADPQHSRPSKAPTGRGLTVRQRRAVMAKGGSIDATVTADVHVLGTGGGSSVPRYSYSGPQPRVADALVLTVAKLGSNVQLSWTGGSGLFTVLSSPDPTFQDGVQTEAREFPSTSAAVTIHPSKALECYDVSDVTVVSRAVQGMGYDPEPTPNVQSVSGTDLWWGDEVTVGGLYFDKIPSENIMFFNHRPQKADRATAGTGTYATDVRFMIPDDARSGPVTVQTHGEVNQSGFFLSLVPPGIGPYSSVRNVSYGYASSPSEKGNIWIAADSVIQEVDIFRGPNSPTPPDPNPQVVSTISGLTKPYISRATSDGRILYIDGVSGHPEIRQITVSSGATAHYANTTDAGFTRNILPVGIAVSRLGGYAFIADASTGKLVRVRAANASAIIDNFGGFTWDFADPCGMDAIDNNFVFASDNGEFVAYTAGQFSTYLAFTTPEVAHSFEIDWDVSDAVSLSIWPIWNALPTAQATNVNPIAPSSNVWRTGAFVEARGDGNLELDPMLFYSFTTPDFPPSAVIINNSGQPFSYLSPNQHLDRVVEVPVQGQPGLKLKLDLLDAPDLAAYAPIDLNAPSTWTQPGASYPYLAKDNAGTTDFGLMTTPTGTPATTQTVTTDSSTGNALVYLKVPARYSGDNFQIAVHKCDYANVCSASKISYLTNIHTSWKRVYVERDKMFRQGGLLKTGAAAGSLTANVFIWANLPACGSELGASPCYQIALLDSTNTYEGPHDEPYVGWVTTDIDGDAVLHLVNADKTDFGSPPGSGLKYSYIASPYPTFADVNGNPSGNSAGIGVLTACDLDPNQINGESCFFEGDLRNIEQPFGDALVQYLAPRSGMSVLPFTPPNLFSAAATAIDAAFSQIWYSHFVAGTGIPPLAQPHDYFHLMGANRTTDHGLTNAGYDFTYVFVGSIEDSSGANSSPHIKADTAHENGHDFEVNPCSVDPGHDMRLAWCDSASHCGLGGAVEERCLMYSPNTINQVEDGVDYFDADDLLYGDPTCAPGNPTPGAIRTDADPQ